MFNDLVSSGHALYMYLKQTCIWVRLRKVYVYQCKGKVRHDYKSVCVHELLQFL